MTIDETSHLILRLHLIEDAEMMKRHMVLISQKRVPHIVASFLSRTPVRTA